MKIGVIGSRTIKDKEWIFDVLLMRFLGKYDVEFISGGAEGVDTLVEEWCKEYNKHFHTIRPVNPKDKLSYLFRNIEIITMSDKLIAIWDKQSKGTKFVIDYAKARGKDIEVITERP